MDNATQPNPAADTVAITQPVGAAPVAASAVPTVSFLTVCAIALLFSATSGFVAWRLASQATATTNIVFVDSGRLAAIGMKQLASTPGMTPEKATAAGAEFLRKLDEALADYTKAGIVVVNSSMVLNRSPVLDVTPLIAERMGFPLQGDR
jgi:hypothetical protein